MKDGDRVFFRAPNEAWAKFRDDNPNSYVATARDLPSLRKRKERYFLLTWPGRDPMVIPQVVPQIDLEIVH